VERQIFERRIAAEHVPYALVRLIVAIVEAEFLLALARAIGLGGAIQRIAGPLQRLAGQHLRYDREAIVGDVAQAHGEIPGRRRNGWRRWTGRFGESHAGSCVAN
jgi:hypothetical protein